MYGKDKLKDLLRGIDIEKVKSEVDKIVNDAGKLWAYTGSRFNKFFKTLEEIAGRVDELLGYIRDVADRIDDSEVFARYFGMDSDAYNAVHGMVVVLEDIARILGELEERADKDKVNEEIQRYTSWVRNRGEYDRQIRLVALHLQKRIRKKYQELMQKLQKLFEYANTLYIKYLELVKGRIVAKIYEFRSALDEMKMMVEVVKQDESDDTDEIADFVDSFRRVVDENRTMWGVDADEVEYFLRENGFRHGDTKIEVTDWRIKVDEVHGADYIGYEYYGRAIVDVKVTDVWWKGLVEVYLVEEKSVEIPIRWEGDTDWPEEWPEIDEDFVEDNVRDIYELKYIDDIWIECYIRGERHIVPIY